MRVKRNTRKRKASKGTKQQTREPVKRKCLTQKSKLWYRLLKTGAAWSLLNTFKTRLVQRWACLKYHEDRAKRAIDEASRRGLSGLSTLSLSAQSTPRSTVPSMRLSDHGLSSGTGAKSGMSWMEGSSRSKSRALIALEDKSTGQVLVRPITQDSDRSTPKVRGVLHKRRHKGDGIRFARCFYKEVTEQCRGSRNLFYRWACYRYWVQL